MNSLSALPDSALLWPGLACYWFPVVFSGKKESIFDLLEDTDADECLATMAKLAAAEQNKQPMMNQAFVFVKPAAATDAGGHCCCCLLLLLL